MTFSYNYLYVETMYNTYTKYIAPLWCSELVFSREYGQCFITSFIIHQDYEYTQELHHNIPSDCIFHNTSQLYMDYYDCIMALNHFSTICFAANLNNKVLLFDSHYVHFYYISVVFKSSLYPTFCIRVVLFGKLTSKLKWSNI